MAGNDQIRYSVGFDVQQNDLKQLKVTLDQLKKQLTDIKNVKIGDIAKINNTDRDTARAYFNDIQNQAARVEDALRKAFNVKLNTVNINQFNRALQSSGSSMQQVYDSFKRAGVQGEQAFRSLTTSVFRTTTQLRESHAVLDKIAQTLTRTLGWNLASSAVNSLTRSVQQAWGYVKSLDTSLNNISIVTGKSADQMADFAVKANDAAQALGKTTTDYTNAALIYAQQGLSDKEVEARTAITLKAANVTGQSTEAVSQELTAVWNGYKVNADEAELYVDRLAAVAATTASDLEELSTGMSKVASAAAAMGVGEDQLAAQLSTIISVTKQAPESVGTALRTVYARISDIQAGIEEDGVTLGNYSGKMAALGFNVLDTSGHLRDMGTVIEQIGGKWQDLTRQQQINLAQVMAGQRQYSNLIALFDNFQQYNKALETAQNAEGTLQSQQDIYMESTAAHLNQLKAAIENIYDSLINADAMDGVLDDLTALANLTAQFIDSLGGGGQMLKSLGSIGLMVFSTQIANGINTTITNLENARFQAEQFKASLAEIQEAKNITNNPVTRSLLSNEEQLTRLSRFMSPQQLQVAQSAVTQLQNNIKEIENISDRFYKIQEGAKEAGIQIKDIGNITNDTVAQLKALDLSPVLKNLVKGAGEDVIKDARIVGEQIGEMVKQGIVGSTDEGKAAIQSALDKIFNLDATANGEEGINNLIQQYRNGFMELKQVLSDQGVDASFITKLEQELNAENVNLDALQQKLGNLKISAGQTSKGLQEMGNNFQRAFNIESIVKFTGSMTTLLNVSQQIKNLGSIWADNTLSGSEKAFQTFSNILLTVSMALPAIKRLNDAIKTLSISQIKETIAAGAATVASKAKAVAAMAVAKAKQIEARRTREAEAADMAEATSSGINAAQNTAQAAASGASAVSGAAGAGAAGVGAAGGLAALGGPITAAVVGITLLIGVIGAVTAAIKKNHQELVKEKQESLEQQKEIQNEIDKNQQLISSIEDLANKRKNGEITRSESIASIKELIEQYGLEKEAIDELAESYDNLSGYVAEQRAEAAKEAAEAAQQRQADAEFLLHDKADNSKYGIDYGDEYYLLTHTPSKETKGEDKLLDILNNTEGVNNLGLGQYSIAVENTTQGLIEAWDTTQEIRKQVAELVLKGQLTWDDIKGSVVQPMLNWNKELAPLIEQGKASLDNTSEKLDLFYSSQAMETMPADFSNIENLSNFIDQWQKLKTETEEKLKAAANEGTDVSGIKASEATDAFIEEYYKDLYLQYGQFTKFMEETEDRLKTDMPESLKEIFSGMSGEQLSAFLELPLSAVDNWKLIAEYAQKIANADVEHTAEALNVNPDVLQDEATERYSKYQEVEDKVRDGKGLNKNQFESLDSDLQDFFYRAANGSYKLKVAAQEFFNAIDDIKLKGFRDNIDLINRDLEKVQNLKEDGWNPDAYEGIDRSAVHEQNIPGAGTFGTVIDKQLVNNQLAYLETLGRSDKALATMVEEWRRLYDQQALSKEQVEAIYQKVAQLGDQTKNLNETQQERLRQQTEAYQQLHDAMFPTDSDVDQGALQSLSSVIQEMADSSAELDNNLDQDIRAADDLAEAILRFDDAITDVTDNYDDWIKALNSGSAQDQAEVIDGLRDAYADLLDMDASALPDSFLKSAENLELMKAAIDGDVDAYDQLLERAGQSVLMDVGLNTDKFFSDRDMVQDAAAQLAGQDFGDIQIGAALNDENFLNALTNMVNAAGMTAQQATDYLASMGVDAEVIEQKSTGTETKQQTGWQSQLVPDPPQTGTAPTVSGLGGSTVVNQLPLLYQTYSARYTPNTSVITDTKENTAFSLKVTSAHKSSGGGFKYSQASHGGGSKHPTSKGSGGKGGGGKGGGGKAPEPDTSQKDRKKDLQDTRDIYHDINVELKQINRELKRAQQKQDRLYGKQLLDNLNEQNRILEKNKVTLQEKHKIQEQDLKTQQEALKNLGVTFDAYGNIANYMDVLGKKQAQITAETAKYNSLIDAYNASTDKDLKKALADEASKIDKKIKEFDDEYKNLEKKIKNYDSLREDMEDVVDQIEEQTQKQIEINIKKFRMAVEIQLKMGQAERDWNKFRREVLEHTDVLKGTDFEEIFANARQNFNDVFSYFDVHGTKGSLQALTEQLIATRAEIEAINETGKSAIYGDNKAQAMEDLQKDLDELMGQMEDVQGLIDDIGKAYLDTIDDIADQFDKQIEDYEYVGDLIEHDIDLLSLLYGDKNYDAMQKYYDALARNNLKQLDSLKQQRDFWKQEWEEAVARGDSKAAEQFEQNYKETIENLNDLIEDSAKTIQDKYVNAIDKIFDELDKKISNGKGTDYLNTQWDLMNKNAEEYLDTINSAFAIQETERKYQKAIDESKNIKSQQTLKKLMDDQLNILRNKEKVSQYDVDRAEKLLQVEQARIALQDAQSAKTTMRLKRDSQGNYSYQYVADNNAVDDARDNLAQAQNDLYNFDKERYQSVLNDMLAAWKDFQSEYKEILEDTSLAEEERIEKLALLREEYGEYINDKTAQNAEARNNLMESAFADMAALYNTDVANYNQMSIDEQNILMGDLVPAWESGIQQMSDKVAGEGGFIPVCEQAFDSITEATKDYEEQLDNMANAAGISLDYVTQGVDLLSYAFEDLIENNDELIDRMYSEVDAIETLQDVARGLVDEYQNVYNEAKTAVSEIHNFIQEEQGRAAAYAETANAAIESYNRTAQAYVEAYDQMASAFENYAARVRAAASGDGSGGTGSGGTGSGSTGNSPSGTTGNPSGSRSSKSSGNNKTIVETDQGFIAGGEYYKRYYGMATGGYTGDWHSSEGKIAVLHQKELVLNEDDTKNFLEGTHILREISSSLQGSISNRISNIGLRSVFSTDKEELEQNVHIEASFPNVNSKKEIEEAFNDLVNLAAQRAMRNN